MIEQEATRRKLAPGGIIGRHQVNEATVVDTAPMSCDRLLIQDESGDVHQPAWMVSCRHPSIELELGVDGE